MPWCGHICGNRLDRNASWRGVWAAGVAAVVYQRIGTDLLNASYWCDIFNKVKSLFDVLFRFF